MKQSLLKGLGCIFGFVAVVYAALAYLVGSTGSPTHDGLGRELSIPPWWARFISAEPVWAGLGWHIVDLVVVFGAGGMAMWLLMKSDDR